MGLNRRSVGMVVGVLVAAAAVAPAIGASQPARSLSAKAQARSLFGLGHFTPAAADPKLAALLARAGLDDDDDFRFTPAESRRSGNRSVTVAVRARSTVTSRQPRDSAGDLDAGGSIGLKPIAYNLGVAVGWKRFAISGDVARVDIAGGAPGSRESADVGVSYVARRFTGHLVASADRPTAEAPRLVGEGPSYSLDVGGSYSLSRRLDVTAGVRYKSENYRLDRISDNRRDSQAVYVGTALRF